MREGNTFKVEKERVCTCGRGAYEGGGGGLKWVYSFFNQGCHRVKRRSRIQARRACWESIINERYLLAIPSTPFALLFDFSALLLDNLY